MFKKYMHLERFGNDEVLGIELGECYVFPKLDGTNASLWVGEDGSVQAGSRNRRNLHWIATIMDLQTHVQSP